MLVSKHECKDDTAGQLGPSSLRRPACHFTSVTYRAYTAGTWNPPSEWRAATMNERVRRRIHPRNVSILATDSPFHSYPTRVEYH